MISAAVPGGPVDEIFMGLLACLLACLSVMSVMSKSVDVLLLVHCCCCSIIVPSQHAVPCQTMTMTMNHTSTSPSIPPNPFPHPHATHAARGRGPARGSIFIRLPVVHFAFPV